MKYKLDNVAYKQWYHQHIRGGARLFGESTEVVATDQPECTMYGERYIDVCLSDCARVAAYVPARFLTPIAEGE